MTGLTPMLSLTLSMSGVGKLFSWGVALTIQELAEIALTIQQWPKATA